MTLPSSGTLSLTNVATEFGLSSPVSMSECLGVPGGPTSGTISISTMYGKSNLTYIPAANTTVNGGSFGYYDSGNYEYVYWSNANLQSSSVCVWTWSKLSGNGAATVCVGNGMVVNSTGYWTTAANSHSSTNTSSTNTSFTGNSCVIEYDPYSGSQNVTYSVTATYINNSHLSKTWTVYLHT